MDDDTKKSEEFEKEHPEQVPTISPDEPVEEEKTASSPDAASDAAPEQVLGKPVKKPRKMPPKKVLIPIIVLVVLIAAAAIYWFAIKKDKPAPAPTNSEQEAEVKVTPKPTTKATSNKDLTTEELAQIERFTKPTTGETWYDTPKDLSLQGYLNSENDPLNTDNAKYIKYYEVGMHGDKTIILSTAAFGPGTDVELYEKTPQGDVSAITHPSSTFDYSTYENYDASRTGSYTDKVAKIDTTTHYDSLSLPDRLAIGSGEYATRSRYELLGDPISSSATTEGTKTLAQYGGSSFSKYEKVYADTKLTAIYYSITTPLNTSANYDFQPIGKDAVTLRWDNKIDLKGNFAGIVRGCGASIFSTSRSDAVTDADFVAAGTSISGDAVYQFKSNSNPLVQKAWQETKDFYAFANDPNNTNDDKGEAKAKANISLEDFVKTHGIFAYRSVANGWLIYTSDNYAPGGGCAKPVVYLYPTTPTQVSVKVGADVKISEPLYDPNTGWHAFAWPNGKLTVNGKTYDSLFWEGPGHGAYPAIASGTVVKRADAVATIRKQLAQQGLNQKESSDFLDYWADKIPNKPYVRLAWFNTAQMDELAPLYISPKPTTVIRVFLDMAGYDTPVSMPAQHLSSIPRTGFTAIEWGGLSLGKLY